MLGDKTRVLSNADRAIAAYRESLVAVDRAHATEIKKLASVGAIGGLGGLGVNKGLTDIDATKYSPKSIKQAYKKKLYKRGKDRAMRVIVSGLCEFADTCASVILYTGISVVVAGAFIAVMLMILISFGVKL